MIELAKITGEVEDGNIRVKLRTGEHLYAPLVTLGSMGIPSEDWIKDNKDSFLAVISYIHDDDTDPICVGFLPVEKAKTDTFGILNRLLEQVIDLVDQLSKGKINTQIGPQPFMPDTQQVFLNITTELKNIKKLLMEK